MNFVVLGNVCIDKNKVENKKYESAGGPPVFISRFLEEKDENMTVISSYGANFLTYEKGLNIYPKSPNINATLVYENVVKSRIRTQKCHFHNQVPPKIDAEMEKILKKADVLFIAPLIPYFPHEYIEKVVSKTSKDCLKILLPQGYFREFDKNNNVISREFKEAEEILPLVDIVIVSNEDYPNIEKQSFVWSKKYGTTFIITKAQKGAIIINKDRKIIVSTTPVPNEQIVDSIGAGDIFAAAFGYNYFKNKDLVKSVKLANQAARKRLLSQ